MLIAIKNYIKSCLYPKANLENFPISRALQYFFFQRILRINGKVPFPTHFSSFIGPINNIVCSDIDKMNKYLQPWIGLSPGVYIQAINGIKFGNNVYIGPGVKIISADHDLKDYTKHVESNPIIIGNNVWIGSNSVILKAVRLGDNTVVAAGSVVTKSFENGFCILAGNPAKIIKKIDR